MADKQELEELPPEDQEYVEAGEGFDHPNVKLMDDQLLLTMNNERLVDGYIKSSEVPVVKAEIRVMGALEKLYAGGYYNVDTARAISAAVFTLERGVEIATDGMGIRLKHSSYNYDIMMGPKKQGGFLKGLFGRNKQEEPVYSGEPRR